MKNCEYYQELISRSLDDALSVEERRELAVHLASCPSCSQMRQLMADISGIMEEELEELPAGLHENIMAGIRRSEMIKANKTAGTPGKHFAPRKFTITRPVRNLLATAACMALVIAAAVGFNPADRAENVIAARSMPEVTESQAPQAAAAAAPESSAAAEVTATPAPTAAAQLAPEGKTAGSDSIITTPAPAQDSYLGTPAPKPTQAPAEVITGTPIGKATATPAPTPAPTPVPTPEPVITEAPVITEPPAPTEAPKATEAPAAYDENRGTEAETSAQEADAAAAAEAPEEMPAEIQKAPPVRLFSMIPSLAELIPEESPAEGKQETTDGAQDAPAMASPKPTSVPVPSDAPQPVALDLKDREKAGDLVLLLAGTLDENGQAPEMAELPEGPWDEGYVAELVFDGIPCELDVLIYGEDVYFSLAEIVIEPAAEESGTGEVAAPEPAPTPAAPPAHEGGAETAADGAAPGEVIAEDFEPRWLLAKCGSKAFAALLDEIVK